MPPNTQEEAPTRGAADSPSEAAASPKAASSPSSVRSEVSPPPPVPEEHAGDAVDNPLDADALPPADPPAAAAVPESHPGHPHHSWQSDATGGTPEPSDAGDDGEGDPAKFWELPDETDVTWPEDLKDTDARSLPATIDKSNPDVQRSMVEAQVAGFGMNKLASVGKWAWVLVVIAMYRGVAEQAAGLSLRAKSAVAQRSTMMIPSC